MAASKYNKKRASFICEMIEKDSYTIDEICKQVEIHVDTYYEWQKKYPEFSEAIQKAKDKFDKKILKECKTSLIKLIKGGEYEEKTTEVEIGKDGEAKPAKIKTVTKKIQPNLGAIIHFQTNRDPENWKNKQSTELTGKDGKDLIPEPITIRIIDEKEQIQNGSIDDKNISGG